VQATRAINVRAAPRLASPLLLEEEPRDDPRAGEINVLLIPCPPSTPLLLLLAHRLEQEYRPPLTEPP
jgi:hypothetical protein